MPEGEGGIAASWRWASVVNSPFVSGEVKPMNLRPFPIGPFSDYTALRAAVVAGSVREIAVRVSQNDVGDADFDHYVFVIPNVVGLASHSSQ